MVRPEVSLEDSQGCPACGKDLVPRRNRLREEYLKCIGCDRHYEKRASKKWADTSRVPGPNDR